MVQFNLSLGGIKGVQAFPKGICPKVIAQVDFKLVHFWHPMKKAAIPMSLFNLSNLEYECATSWNSWSLTISAIWLIEALNGLDVRKKKF